MAGVPPHPSAAHGQPPAVAYAPQPMQHAAGAGAAAAPLVQGLNQGTAEFFLSNYRLGKTLGIGSFGKVRGRRTTGAWSCACRPGGQPAHTRAGSGWRRARAQCAARPCSAGEHTCLPP
jgi:hypothetical protein